MTQWLWRAGTIFAYGQTGTGKTFQMEGLADEKNKGVESPHIRPHFPARRDLHRDGPAC